MDIAQKNNAKFAFYYMLSLVSLAFVAIGIGMIFFQIINKYVADQLREFRTLFNPETVKYAISMIVVAAPIFYVVMWQIFKSLFSGQLDRESGVRRWLVYFILFVSAVIVIGTLINTLNSFLNGELTLKFVLKALTVGGIAALIFSFFLYDIRRTEVAGAHDKVVTIYFYGSVALVVAALIFSLFIIESPQTSRDRKLDNAILSNFDEIDAALNSYYNEKGFLPSSLDDLEINYKYLSPDVFVDPATGTKFDYKIISSDEYELCATFRLSLGSDDQNIYYDTSFKQRWAHGAGYQCIGQRARSYQKGDMPTVVPVPARID